MTCHGSDLGSACFNQSEAALPSIRNGISALVPQKSFCGQYSGGVAKCPPFSKWLNLLPGKRQTKNMKLYLFQNITAAITATSNKTAITGPTTAPTGVDGPSLTGSVGDWDGTTTERNQIRKETNVKDNILKFCNENFSPLEIIANTPIRKKGLPSSIWTRAIRVAWPIRSFWSTERFWKEPIKRAKNPSREGN